VRNKNNHQVLSRENEREGILAVSRVVQTQKSEGKNVHAPKTTMSRKKEAKPPRLLEESMWGVNVYGGDKESRGGWASGDGCPDRAWRHKKRNGERESMVTK